MRTCVRGVICLSRPPAYESPPLRRTRSARDGEGARAGQADPGAGCEGTRGSAPGIPLTRRDES